MWVLVTLVVATTVAITFGIEDGRGQQNANTKDLPTPTPASSFGDLSKYPVVGYDDPESFTEAEYQQRLIKNKRYDVSLPVAKNPHPDDFAITGTDVEPEPPAIPIAESSLVIIGEVLSSKALLSNDKKGVYSEFSVLVSSILKGDKQRKMQVNDKIDVDRAGGLVKYPSGQKLIYLIDWQNLPEIGGRYVFFLSTDDVKNPNYKILTAYRITNNKVMALDNSSKFAELNGTNERDFTNIILNKK